MTTTPDPTAWVGWTRTLVPLRPWRQACSAATQGECWDRLLWEEEPSQQVERCVLVKGKHPEKRRKPR